MAMNNIPCRNIDEYISFFPEPVRERLVRMRSVIKKAAPNAEEAISYAIPTFKLNGNLVHFAAFKNHLGFYPGPSGIEAFKKELAGYESSKGTIKFPLDKPIPVTLVGKIVKFRVKENLAKVKTKSKKK